MTELTLTQKEGLDALVQDMDFTEFLSGVAKGFCPECGNVIHRNPVGRPKQFCSEKCRRAWYNKHPHPENWKSSEIKFCPVCGKAFLSAKDYEHKRKYCSRSCANRARAGKGEA